MWYTVFQNDRTIGGGEARISNSIVALPVDSMLANAKNSDNSVAIGETKEEVYKQIQ